MGEKSTLFWQVCLAAILAQLGVAGVNAQGDTITLDDVGIK
jgi:DNA mismatch repair ATPase MutS